MSHVHSSTSMAGMDMGTDNSTSTMTMLTAFSTSLGASNLWFPSWTPTSSGAMAGASLGLFFLAIFSRLLSAIRTVAERSWKESLLVERSIALGLKEEKDSTGTATTLARDERSKYAATPPFRFAVDIPRALLFVVQSFVGYLLMLAVMSYGVYFFIAILAGLGIGELAFGRYIAAMNGGGHDEGGLHF